MTTPTSKPLVDWTRKELKAELRRQMREGTVGVIYYNDILAELTRQTTEAYTRALIWASAASAAAATGATVVSVIALLTVGK